jgi:hypothetical protein
MSSPIYQNMGNIIVSFSIRKCPSKFMDVTMWEHCTFDRFLEFITLTPLSLLISCKLSFPIVGLKMSFLPTFALKSPSKIFMWYLGKVSNTHPNSSVKEIQFEPPVNYDVVQIKFQAISPKTQGISLMGGYLVGS